MNFTDSTWKAITQILDSKISIERARNDDVKLDASQTAFCRGRISAFKELLALPIQQAARAGKDEPQ